MFRKHEMILSKHMGRSVHIWRYGHFGPPVIAFPGASGMAHKWENYGMTAALGDWLEEGKLKLYTAESNVSAVWTRKEEHPQANSPCDRLRAGAMGGWQHRRRATFRGVDAGQGHPPPARPVEHGRF